MKVKTSSHDCALHQNIAEVAAYIQLQGFLSSGYYVLLTNSGYQICWLDDDDWELVDASLRPEWQGFEDDSEFTQQSRRLFPEFTPSFWEDLLNEERYAIRIFEEKRRLYSGPHLKVTRWLGFEYPMRKLAVEHLDSLFRYDYPTYEEAIARREELSCLLREIMQEPPSNKTLPASDKELYALNLAIQQDEVGVAMFLLSHTRAGTRLDDTVEYHGRVYPPALLQAVSNISTDALKLLLGYGARTNMLHIDDSSLSDELMPLLKMSPQERYADGGASLL